MPRRRRVLKPRGGPPKSEARALYLELVSNGVNNSRACLIVGVHRKTGTRWSLGRTLVTRNGRVGLLKLSPHGLATVAGFAAGARLMRPDAEARGISREQRSRMLTRAGMGAVVGARAAYVANHLSECDNPLEWLAVWHGGISLFGGIAGAVLAAYPDMRRLRFPAWMVLDAAAPALALGIVIGRVGDLIVGDHLGKPTRSPLGFLCPASSAATASPCDPGAGVAVHLPALYDLVSVRLLLVVLLVLRRRPHREGFMIAVFATW